MPQMKTYDLVGVKEDISDVISNIDPTKTPFTSLISDESVSNIKFNWQEDRLRDPRKNAAVEGFVATDRTRSPTSMRENNTQIFEDTISVSTTADVVSKYGRAKELAYQLAKTSVELKRDREYAMVGTGQTAVMGDGTTAREMAGYQAQVDAAVTVDALNTALSEDHVLTANQKLYNAGAEASVIMIKPDDSLKFSNFAHAAGRTRDISNGTKIVNVVDLYVSPFGEQRVVLNRFQRATDALLFDPDMWKAITLRGWSRETLAKRGDSTEVMVVGEFSLKHRNFRGSALIKNLT